MTRLLHTLVVGLSIGTFASSVQAEPLNLALLDFPDIASGFIDVTYDAFGDQFVADGFALSIDDDGIGPQIDIVGGAFNITATINDLGMPIGGTLTIEGGVLGSGPTLLTGILTDFGFEPGGGDLFEFLFDVSGGDLAIPSLYGDPGAVVGVILDANGSDFGGAFGGDFDNLTAGISGTGIGVSDTAPIPEPASIILLMVGVAASCGRMRPSPGRFGQ